MSVNNNDSARIIYQRSNRKKYYLLIFCAIGLFIITGYAIATGSYGLSLASVIKSLSGEADQKEMAVIWNIRLPRITAAIFSGWGLGLAGCVMQSLLKNPLVSPFTLGISHGAAFGAAFAIVVLQAGMTQISAIRTNATELVMINNMALTTICAFLGSMITTVVILLLARIKKLSSQAIILAGIALSSLFVSGTILIQYFANEVELASIVFWTFGDVARSNWKEIGITAICVIPVTAYFFLKRWELNALDSGDDSAKSLGVHVERVRLIGMVLTALVASFVTAFHGVIAFLGLLAPHIAKRLVSSNHVLLIPMSCMIGAMLLLVADTVGRSIIGSGTLPVGVLTSFMGAPLFLYLLIKGKNI
ncbi:MAG: FecCD family ABC transporter permease [Syntrophorhabdus sp.]